MNENENSPFYGCANAVRELRISRGMCLEMLSETTEIEIADLAYLEAGAQRPISEHRKVAAALGVDIEDLHPSVADLPRLLDQYAPDDDDAENEEADTDDDHIQASDARRARNSGLSLGKRYVTCIHFSNGKDLAFLLDDMEYERFTNAFQQRAQNDYKGSPILTITGLISSTFVRLDEIEAIESLEQESGSIYAESCVPQLNVFESVGEILFRSGKQMDFPDIAPLYELSDFLPYGDVPTDLAIQLNNFWLDMVAPASVDLDTIDQDDGTRRRLDLDLRKVFAIRIPHRLLTKSWAEAHDVYEIGALSDCHEGEIDPTLTSYD